MKTESRLGTERRRWTKAMFGLLCGFLPALLVPLSATVAFADTPAVTDFGQVDVAPVLTDQTNSWKEAVFLTFYPDGRSHTEIHGVTDDAENTFVGEHPSWQLDHSLTWFVQMPVYVRKLSTEETLAGRHSV